MKFYFMNENSISKSSQSKNESFQRRFCEFLSEVTNVNSLKFYVFPHVFSSESIHELLPQLLDPLPQLRQQLCRFQDRPAGEVFCEAAKRLDRGW